MKFERCAGVVPYAVVVGCDDLECVGPGSKVGIERFATVPTSCQSPIRALELVAEVHPLGHGQAARRVLDLQSGGMNG